MVKINILLCDRFPGLLPPEIPSYESMFMDLYRSVCEDADFEVFHTMDGILPDKFDRDELYIITGSNNSAYEDVPWIESLKMWIRKAVALQVKLLGICFGHQVIAHALGGNVVRHTGGWGIGIRESVIADEEMKPFFADGHLRLLYNHHDHVASLPDGATAIAYSEFCRYEGFRIDSHVLTFQGHPEFTPAYELHLIRNHAEDEDETVKSEAIKSIKSLKHQGRKVAEYSLHFFVLS